MKTSRPFLYVPVAYIYINSPFKSVDTKQGILSHQRDHEGVFHVPGTYGLYEMFCTVFQVHHSPHNDTILSTAIEHNLAVWSVANAFVVVVSKVLLLKQDFVP